MRGRAKDALAEYEAILAHPNLERLADRPQLLTDAAAAATHSGNPTRGLALAEQALALDSGAPAGVVQRAHALLALNKPEAAQAALRDVDLNRVTGHGGARYHVAAAAIFIQVGLAKQAVTELLSALDADPNWPPVHLVSAQSKLLVGNLGGAIEDI